MSRIWQTNKVPSTEGKTYSIMLGTRVRKTQTVEVLCICRTMNEKTRPMIECESCLKWFHKDCMGLDVNKSFKGVKWVCRGCEDFIK